MSSPNLIIHHLRRSQSERVIWLCEELGIPYKLESYDRVPPHMLAPDNLRELHWSGTAPVIQDGDITLTETNAIFEYILAKYGNGKLVLQPTHQNYSDYVFWLHLANGSFLPALIAVMLGQMTGASKESPVQMAMQHRVDKTLKAMDQQLKKFQYLAGDDFTSADCISIFGLTTFRFFVPYDLTGYPNIVSYLQRIGEREGYKRAMEKGDPGFAPILSALPPQGSN